MRILLPPSEAKRPGGRAVPAAPEGDPVLAAARAKVLAALVELSSGDPTSAANALALPARSAADDLALNRASGTAARVPALRRYAGTVYEGLDFASLTPPLRRRAGSSIVIFSGLWGVVGGDEPVPSYRLPVAATLPDVGALTSFWRPILAEIVPALLDDRDDELIVDLRSSDYAAMWRPVAALRDRVVNVRVLSDLPGQAPAVVSYPSKLGKGRLARALVGSRARLRRREQLVDAWRVAGGRDGWVTDRGVVELLT